MSIIQQTYTVFQEEGPTNERRTMVVSEELARTAAFQNTVDTATMQMTLRTYQQETQLLRAKLRSLNEYAKRLEDKLAEKIEGSRAGFLFRARGLFVRFGRKRK